MDLTPPQPKDDDNTCSICYSDENQPSMLRHKTCRNLTHKECLYGWMDVAVSKRNPTAFNCAKCRQPLPLGMLLAASNGNFDNLAELFYKYKNQLDLSTAEFKEMLDEIPEMTKSTKDRILNYVRNRRPAPAPAPAPAHTQHEHQMQVIAALNNNNSGLYNIFYTHLHNILFNRYETDAAYRRNMQMLTNMIFYYNIEDGRPVRINDNTVNELKLVFAEKIYEFLVENKDTIVFNATVLLYPYRRMYDTMNNRQREPYSRIHIEETIHLNTELQSFYNNKLQEHGIILTENEYETHRILTQNPFPEPITGYEYVRQKIIRNPFSFLGGGHQALKEINFYDSIEVVPTNTSSPSEEPVCEGNTCTIMGGKTSKKRRITKRRRKTTKSTRFYRR